MTITSVHNPRVKELARLRDRKGRVAQGLVLIDGRREIERALEGGARVVEVYHLEPSNDDGGRALARLLERLISAGAATTAVSPAVLDKLAYGDRNEGLVAVAAPRSRTLAELPLPEKPLIAVLEEIEKPGNIGAVLRSADAAGVSAVIATHPRSDFFNPNAIRASLGAVFTTPVATASPEEVLAWLERAKLPIFAARVTGAVDFDQADFTGGGAIVLGAETSDVSEFWRREGVIALRLPMLGAVDSLNVSATAAVLFYEALRQRKNSDHGRNGV